MNLKLIDKTPEASDAISFSFIPDEYVKFKPGQFFKYHIHNNSPDKRGESRFFTISAAPFENKIMITTRINRTRSSSFKKDLFNLKIGETIEGEGPKGSFILENPNRELVFIAGGIGITPFRSMLLDLDHKGKPLNMSLLYATRDKDAFFHKEFEKLARKHPEFKIYYVVSGKNTQAEKMIHRRLKSAVSSANTVSENVEIIPGKIDEDLIKKLIPNFKDYIFYTSGPEPMVENIEKILESMGVSEVNSKRDYFPGYEKY